MAIIMPPSNLLAIFLPTFLFVACFQFHKIRNQNIFLQRGVFPCRSCSLTHAQRPVRTNTTVTSLKHASANGRSGVGVI
ncbi:hypothetical protein ECG_04826 [Echinococcus granulosus]|nr:hypothetical protein ECG_04826 [Echinococcus granulosus]